MNMKLCNVLSDTTGQTGMAIIDGILADERDLATLTVAKRRVPIVRWS